MKLLKKSIILGVIGMLISSFGVLVAPSFLQKLLFLFGAFFLISSSIIEKHRLYIWLQVIVISGTLSAFLPVERLYKAAVPILVGIFYLSFSFKIIFRDKNEILGAFGVIALSVGFAVSHPAIYLIGAILISTYSFCEFCKGVKIALLWFILNLIFALTAIRALYI